MRKLNSECQSRTYLRDIAKLLRKLSQSGVSLVPHRDKKREGESEAPTWCLWNKHMTDQIAYPQISHRLVSQLISDDLVQQVKCDQWQINRTGRSWLKRHLSGSDPFQAQQMCLVKKALEVDGVQTMTAVNVAESPLAWLRQRNGRSGIPLLDDAQFLAGERLRFDFTRAHLSPRMTADWSAIPNSTKKRSGEQGGAADLLDSVIEAGKRFNRAIQDVGPELSDVLVDVCCFLKGLEETEQKNKWPRRSAKLVLQMALTRLARHYGLNSMPKASKRSTKGIRQWGTQDYRPVIEGKSH